MYMCFACKTSYKYVHKLYVRWRKDHHYETKNTLKSKVLTKHQKETTYLWSIPHYTTADQTSRPWVGPACRTWPLLRNKTGCQQKHRIRRIFLAILAAARRHLRAAVENGEVVQQVEGSTVAIPGRGAVMVGAAAYVTVELSDICAALLPSVPFAVVTERLPVALTGVATPATITWRLLFYTDHRRINMRRLGYRSVAGCCLGSSAEWTCLQRVAYRLQLEKHTGNYIIPRWIRARKIPCLGSACAIASG